MNDIKAPTSHSEMTPEQASKYCYFYRDEYIRGFDSISEGSRDFDCLIYLVKEGNLKGDELPAYGMDFPIAPAFTTNPKV